MSEPSDETRLADELTQLKDLVASHGKKTLTVLLALAVILVGIRMYRSHKQSSRQEASALFGSAQSVEQLETLVSEYDSAPSAPLAKLRLAKTYFDAGDFEQALVVYNEIRDEHGNRAPASDAADLGIAASIEATGQIEEALGRFDRFLEDHPQHFLAPQALLGKARCLDKLYRTAEAKAVMEDYIAANPDSQWIGPAEDLLDRLNEKMAQIDRE